MMIPLSVRGPLYTRSRYNEHLAKMRFLCIKSHWQQDSLPLTLWDNTMAPIIIMQDQIQPGSEEEEGVGSPNRVPSIPSSWPDPAMGGSPAQGISSSPPPATGSARPWYPTPVNRITSTTENITFPRTRYVVGKNVNIFGLTSTRLQQAGSFACSYVFVSVIQKGRCTWSRAWPIFQQKFEYLIATISIFVSFSPQYIYTQ